MIWALYGILHSIMRAAQTETARTTSVDSLRLSFWQALAALVVLLPLLPFMTWSRDLHFYMAAGGVALILALGILVQAYLTAQKSGRVSSVYIIVEALAAFVIWMIVAHDYPSLDTKNLLPVLAVMAAFFMGGIGLMKVRPQDVTLRTFAVVAPIGISYAVAAVVTRIIMPLEDILPVALSYACVGFAVTAAVLGGALVLKGKAGAGLVSRPLVRGGALAGLFMAAGYVAFILSVALAPNPGYTAVLAMTAPVWLMVWHLIRRKPDAISSPLAALLIVISALLVIAAGM